MAFESLIQCAISGLQGGCIYALMALSYLMILRSTAILNFAQGEWLMIAGVLGVVSLRESLPYPLAIIVSILGTVVLALSSERLVIRPLEERHAPLPILILSLLGIMIVARYGTGLLFGPEDYPLPGPVGNEIVRLGTNIFASAQTLVVYTATAAIFAGDSLFTRYTWLGRSLRVAAIDPVGASIVGVDLGLVRIAAFGLGGLVAAIVGWLYAPLYAVGYNIGIMPGIKGFIVLIVGGTASPIGALVGGLILGVVEVTAARYISSLYSEALAFVLLMAVLFVRPRGIIGQK